MIGSKATLASLVLFASSVVAQTITGQYDCEPAGQYTLCQNLWGKSSGVGSQSSTLVSASGNSVSWSTNYTWANNSNNVKSYANLSAITSAPTIWNWHYVTQSSGIQLRADISYELWLGKASSGSPATPASSYEIMIWLSGLGGIQPVGSQILTGISVGGHTWNLWKGPNANWQVLSFVPATGDITNFNADLKDFLNYLVSNQGVASTQSSVRRVQAIQTGTEPFVGTANLVIDSYSVAFNH
ncbi:endocellulase [Gloeopeniophorella convolvens]|nr:endocellulase [Gloeopeniophorella convolvens]